MGRATGGTSGGSAAPAGPTTPAGGGRGAATTPGGGGAGRGAPITFSHQRTSKRALNVDWDFPVYQPPEQKPVATGGTVSTVIEQALPRQEAFAWLSQNDKRPLLVLRECGRCKGTDEALLSRTLKNEDTQLLSRFFHCVKLPLHVMQQQHPFHELFEREHPPHVLVASHDGSFVLEMTGTYTQGDLWRAMQSMLEREYAKDARAAVKQLVKLLGTFDHLDSIEDEIRTRMEKEIEKNGPKAQRLADMQKDLDELEKKRKAALALEQQILDLGLRANAASAAPAAPKKDDKAGG